MFQRPDRNVVQSHSIRVPASSLVDAIPAVILSATEALFSLFTKLASSLHFLFPGMWPQWLSTWGPSGILCLCTLFASPYVPYAVASYPVSPDAQACSLIHGHPLGHRACQAALDNLPRGTLPSIFTNRAHTATNNYIQVPVRYWDIGDEPSCMITIDLDGHSQSDQFVFVPWNEIREMAQIIVDTCVDIFNRGGFITYGVGRTLEAMIHPTAYGGNNAEVPTPAWVQQPDGTVEYVAIPSIPATNVNSK